MKVVINTQVRENYGSADKPYWKCKGGQVFVVPGLTVEQTLKIKEKGIPTLTALINTFSPMYEEFVADWAIMDDSEKVCEAWETPFELRYLNGRWIATRTVENGEYGYMRQEVERKTEEYDMVMGGGQANYRVVYTMRNGDMVTGSQVEAYLTKAA